jgi:prepilin-type N-terminal cleavage/methylation domain-containing protein/prepilin-type processing-associated H-X9-DG protein
MRKSGFTLIELLVVIAIIAILAAILFPVFERAKQKAQQAGCMSNLKQIGVALLMYAHDWDNILPMRSYGGGGCVGTPAAPGLPAWGGRSGWLWPYTQSEEVLFCPAVTQRGSIGYDCSGAQKPGGAVFYSYIANGIYSPQYPVSRDSDWAGWTNMVVSGVTYSYDAKSLDYFPYPTHFIVFSDGTRWQQYHVEQLNGVSRVCGDSATSNSLTLYANAEPPTWGYIGSNINFGGVLGRHNGTANHLFLDGHVAPMTPSILAGNSAYTGITNRLYFFDASSKVNRGQSKP